MWGRGRLVLYSVGIAVVCALAVVVSEPADWRPLSLLAALAVLLLLADTVLVPARRITVSAGLLVQVMIMALMGPAPAVAVGVAESAVVDRIKRLSTIALLTDVLIFALLGLIGGLLFDEVRGALDLDRRDVGYAVVVAVGYALLVSLNLVLVAWLSPLLDGDRRRVIRETGVPLAPWELLNAVMAGLMVVVWAQVGLVGVAGMLLVLVTLIPLLQAVGAGIASGDDRDRLLAELLLAERRERARLAESLHDGPIQLLAAMRLRVDGELARQLDAAIEETRAIVASLHPDMVREIGFEASVRAAAAPFRCSRPFDLSVHGAFDDRALADTLLLPIAQELVVNAAKHARPTKVDVTVTDGDGRIVLDVSDDGIGLPEGADAARGLYAGLAIVRRRVRDVGGTFDIAGNGGGGTRARATVPIGRSLRR
jgi:signal transduction histidine kinase